MMNGPAVTVNGLSEHNGSEGEPVWERLWSLEEIRRTSGNWSLAADAGLLLFLQDFSQQIISKTHEIEKQLDGLIRETKTTDCRLHNVFNDFLMLSNTQFIENRVYDEELEDPVSKPETGEKNEQEKTREQKEAELIPKVQEAVNHGLRVLESAFEQLDIKAGNSDSEEEEVNERVELILEPKDLYIDRPLPCLIGSKQFMEQDDVGLGDLSTDEESIDSDRGSIIDTEDDHDELSEDDSEYQKEDEEKSMHSSEDEDYKDDNDSDLFGDSEKEEDGGDEEDTRTRKRGSASTFADELAARIKGETLKVDAERTSLSSVEAATKKRAKEKKETRKQQSEDNSDDLFRPSETENEDFSIFSGTGGLFSGKKGLFDDEEEGDLFADAPKEEPQKEPVAETHPNKEHLVTKSAKKVPVGAVSIFPAAGDNLFNPSVQESDEDKATDKKPNEVKPSAIKQSVTGGLFDDDDDYLFTGSNMKKSNSAPEKSKSKPASDLFVEDDDDLFKEKVNSDTSAAIHKQAGKKDGPFATKKDVKHSVEVSESAPKPSEKSQHTSLFSDEEDSQDFFSSSQTMNKGQSKPSTLPQSKSTTLSLFSDEEEDNLFVSAPVKIQTASSVKKQQEPLKSAPQPSKPKIATLFSSDDEDHWESTKKGINVPKDDKDDDPTKRKSVAAKDNSLQKKASSSLFDAEEDLFDATKKDSHTKPKKVSLLFEDENEDSSLFGSKIATSKSVPEIAPKPSPKPKIPSLFDEDENEAVFEKTTENKATGDPEKKKKPAGAVSLFGGIDVLKVQKKEVAEPSKSTTVELEEEDPFKDSPPPLEKTVKPLPVPSLFDDENDDEEEEKIAISKVKTVQHQSTSQVGHSEKMTPELDDDEDPFKATPPPFQKKTKPENLPSLFDEEEEEEEGKDEREIIVSVVKTPLNQDISKSAEENTRSKSTRVFQDEELLFSQKQQKDNDPEVDLFAATKKPLPGKPSFSKVPPGPSLFVGDEEEEDLFTTVKPKQSPKSIEPVPFKNKEPSSRIGKLQATLVINPASLLPGSAPRIPGAAAVMPGASLPSSRTYDVETSVVRSSIIKEDGVSFDLPAQADTLHSAVKSRVKVTGKRRPRSRAARQLAAQLSSETEEFNYKEVQDSVYASVVTDTQQHQPTELTVASGRKQRLEENPTSASANPLTGESKDISSAEPKTMGSSFDIFHSDVIFPSVPPTQIDSKPKENSFKEVASKTVKIHEKDPSFSVFDHSSGGDLFHSVKQKTKKLKPTSFLEDEDDDDLFGTKKTAPVKKDSRPAVHKESKRQANDIFEDDIFASETAKPAKKTQEKTLASSLFDEDVDIFADVTVKPKEKKTKKKTETKSIFDDDMDDIFSTNSKTKTTKPKSKSGKKAPDITADVKTSSIFDDPLNVLGGN
ncbi:WASH complex subunit 2A-like isoform X2 [Protopterus annectens]|uniref:WASH complex subunit 2A-like isoform X2 n=1 Tax=Protopterus annectens TaxID=7888 RepID=UPI001CFB290F|nr:WASH complex subunit 2A-like isoform X2 [Protopterus annectens]